MNPEKVTEMIMVTGLILLSFGMSGSIVIIHYYGNVLMSTLPLQIQIMFDMTEILMIVGVIVICIGWVGRP